MKSVDNGLILCAIYPILSWYFITGFGYLFEVMGHVVHSSMRVSLIFGWKGPRESIRSRGELTAVQKVAE